MSSDPIPAGTCAENLSLTSSMSSARALSPEFLTAPVRTRPGALAGTSTRRHSFHLSNREKQGLGGPGSGCSRFFLPKRFAVNRAHQHAINGNRVHGARESAMAGWPSVETDRRISSQQGEGKPGTRSRTCPALRRGPPRAIQTRRDARLRLRRAGRRVRVRANRRPTGKV